MAEKIDSQNNGSAGTIVSFLERLRNLPPMDHRDDIDEITPHRSIGQFEAGHGRYIVRCEDEPAMFQNRFDNIGEAVQCAHDVVANMIFSNGCGDGVVVDSLYGSVVAVFGHGSDDHEANAEAIYVKASGQIRGMELDDLVKLVMAWENCEDRPLLPFICCTWSG